MSVNFRFLPLEDFAIQSGFPMEQPNQVGTLSPRPAWNESCCWDLSRESHASVIANHGTNEWILQIQPAPSMVTKGNIEEIDQKWKNLWELIQILVQVWYAQLWVKALPIRAMCDFLFSSHFLHLYGAEESVPEA